MKVNSLLHLETGDGSEDFLPNQSKGFPLLHYLLPVFSHYAGISLIPHLFPSRFVDASENPLSWLGQDHLCLLSVLLGFLCCLL